MKTPATNRLVALGLVAIGLAVGAAGIYVGEIDDAPGAALLGILLMITAIFMGARTALRKNSSTL
jgi:tetrahydromethanopterin S-methyltransferase subunit C